MIIVARLFFYHFYKSLNRRYTGNNNLDRNGDNNHDSVTNSNAIHNGDRNINSVNNDNCSNNNFNNT
jgi:hypothetical protein